MPRPLCFLLALGLATPAAAKPLAVFVTPAKADAESDARLLEQFMRDQVATLEGATLVTGAGPGVTPPNVADSVEAGYRMLNDYATAKPDAKPSLAGAITAFSGARDALVAHEGPLGEAGRRLLARTLKGLAVALATTGKNEEAQPLVRDSLNLWPEQSAMEYAWSKEAYTLFGFAAKMRESKKAGSLAIEAEPGFRVVVDGRPRGYTPATVTDLAPGLHWVELSRDGYTTLGQSVEIGEGEEKKVALAPAARGDKEAFEAALAKAAKARSAKRAAGPLGDVMRITGAEALIVVRGEVKKGAFQLRGWASGAEPKPIKVEIPRDASLRDNLQKLLTDTFGVAAGGSGAPDPSLGGPPKTSVFAETGGAGEAGDKIADPEVEEGEEGAESEAFYETWWFWTAVGVGVAGATAGILVAVLGGEDEEPVVRTGTLEIDFGGLQ